MADSLPPRQVALLVETSNAYARGLLRGVIAYVRSHDPWTLRLSEHGRGEIVRHEVGPRDHGVIARIENDRIADVLRRRRGPVIDVSAARLLPKLPWVETDDAAIAVAAANHFLERGLRQFGFAGAAQFQWSENRGAAFERELDQLGHRVAFAPEDGDDLVEWLRDLPKPVGIFACYDPRGREVLVACRRAGLRVPDEVAVIGVDDDELLCELADPPLSSVVPDARRTGWLAAELLHGWMHGVKPAGLAHPVPPVGVTTRRSTDMLAVEDPDIATAVRFIREHACDGITVHDVVSKLPLSRRMLETRFQKYLGRTPHEEILRVRLERAKAMLLQPNWTLDAIAGRVGFGHGEYFSAAFKREVGLTPGAWRAQHRG